MSTLDLFLWGAAPYIVLTTLVVATAIRRVFFQRTWTAKSSEFLAKSKECIWTPVFHLALLLVLLGHIGGLLVPKEFLESFGINDHLYHMAALSMGGAAGVLLVLSVIMLAKRRFAGGPRIKINTSRMDKVMYVFLALTILCGICATLSNADGAFDYRVTISPWIRSVLALQPDPSLMVSIPLLFKLHMCGWMLLFALIPFTRLVHLFSGFAVPFKYIGRSAIVYRRRKQAPAGRELEFPEQTGFAGK